MNKELRKGYEIPKSVGFGEWESTVEWCRASALLVVLDCLASGEAVNKREIQSRLHNFEVKNIDINSVVEKAGDNWMQANDILDKAIDRSMRSKRAMDIKRIRKATDQLICEDNTASMITHDYITDGLQQSVMLSGSIFGESNMDMPGISINVAGTTQNCSECVDVSDQIPSEVLYLYRTKAPTMTNKELLDDYKKYQKENSFPTKMANIKKMFLKRINSIPAKFESWFRNQRLYTVRTKYDYPDKGKYTKSSFPNIVPSTRDVK